MNDNDELNYVSSVDPFQPEDNKPSVDVEDEKALEAVRRVLEEQISLYNTIPAMKLFPSKFSADEREALCNQYVLTLSSLLLLINNAISGIKDKQPK